MRTLLAGFSLILMAAALVGCGCDSSKASMPKTSEGRLAQAKELIIKEVEGKIPEPNREVTIDYTDNIMSVTAAISGEFQDSDGWWKKGATITVTWPGGSNPVPSPLSEFKMLPDEAKRRDEIIRLRDVLEAFDRMGLTPLAPKFITTEESSNPNMRGRGYEDERILAIPIQVENPTQEAHKVEVYVSFDTFLPPTDPVDESRCGEASGLPILHWYPPETVEGNWEFEIQPGSQTVNIEYGLILSTDFLCMETEVREFHLVSIDGFEEPSDVKLRISKLENEAP
ncbi:MAG: hypothetical protein A2172_03075 [Candidatus Woykebacteria bacterium RBG_13_40_15]|uniref:Uncharacterized protein n=1 Tax=Candidatus Woykebacteria bacterium RBG_13_40_15 TaxID=1802593 RepID=A0A1G1W5D6_9BACT|nr:MAG: hypothetical protein A2172_03075 [Candidatus Woykebacteria bacterium RBG_13_40_15]